MGKQNQVELRFGAMVPTIAKQLKAQKVAFDPSKVKLYQRLADAIVILSVHGIITDKTVQHKRVFRKVMDHVKAFNTTKQPRRSAPSPGEGAKGAGTKSK